MSRNDFFGIDIGSAQIKAVQLEPVEKGYRLVSFGLISSTGKSFLSENESDLTDLAERIKKLHREGKFRSSNVVVALPEDQIYSELVTMPKMTGEELEGAMRWEAEKYIPISLEEAVLSYQIVGQFTNGQTEKLRVFLAAAPRRLVQKMNLVLNAAGLNPVSVETEMIALARSLVGNSQDPALLIDFGAKSTDVAIVEKSQVMFSRSLPIAGETLTRAISSTLGLAGNQAEEYKKAYGVDPTRLEGKIKQVLEPLLTNVAEEIRKIIEFYKEKVGEENHLSRIVLSGGSANLPEVVSFFASYLGVEVQKGDPFSFVVKDTFSQQVPAEQIPFLGIATGLAMKKIE